MSSTNDSSTQITREAMVWVLAISRSNPTREQRKRLSRWMLLSDEHMRRLHITLNAFPRLTGGGKPISDARIKAWLEQAPRVISAVDAIYPQGMHPEDWRPRTTRPAFDPVKIAIAACLVVVAVLVVFFLRQGPEVVWQHFSAPADRFLRVRLADGSMLSLYPGAVADVGITSETREVRLLKVGAIFNVAHDSKRPFSVATAGGGVVEVLGTIFDVRMGPDGTLVDVVEGVVSVAGASGANRPIHVTAGQRARISNTGWADYPRKDAMDGRYAGLQQPLALWAMEYNLYSSDKPITVLGSACELSYRPVLSSSNQDLIEILKLDTRLQLTISGGGVVVRERGDTSGIACVADTTARVAR